MATEQTAAFFASRSPPAYGARATTSDGNKHGSNDSNDSNDSHGSHGSNSSGGGHSGHGDPSHDLLATDDSPPAAARAPRRPSLSSFPPSAAPPASPRWPSRSPQPPFTEPPPVPGVPASYMASGNVAQPNSVAAAASTDRTSNQSNKSTKAPSSSATGDSSLHSSLSTGAGAGTGTGAGGDPPGAHPPRRLRSQYPRGTKKNHVDYILVAYFDERLGPSMAHQYPVAITGEGNMLAELMLPDQTHLRSQDWTMFFLHKDTTPEEEENERQAKQAARERRRQRRARRAAGVARRQAAARAKTKRSSNDDDDAAAHGDGLLDSSDDGDADDGGNADGDHREGEDPDAFGNGYDGDGNADDDDDDDDDYDEDDDFSSDSEPEGGEGAPLTYVLNLVNTKPDTSKPRGVDVKAMAICTRHPFLHIYKPLLLLALEEYFKSPVPETLALLYDAVNAMDLSLMPRLSLLERHLLQASDNKDLFVEKFEHMIQMRLAREAAANSSGGGSGGGGGGGSLPEQPLDASRSPVKPAGILRSGTKAHVEGPTSAAYAVPRDTHEFESRVYYKGIPIPIKVPVAIMPENVGDFSLIKLIQNFSEPHAKAPQPFPLHAHLTTNGPYTHPIIVLVNALLTQKRVLFLGAGLPSGDVAEAVLAACALASGGVLRGFTRHAFPYTDLTKIDDLLQVPGFIAGVTNPAFEMHPEWWDLLCDIPSGRIKVSSRIEEAPLTEGGLAYKQQYPSYANLVSAAMAAPAGAAAAASNDLTGDHAFMADILKSVAARMGERVVRAKWRDWVVKFTRIAAAFEETVYGASVLTMGAAAGAAVAAAAAGAGVQDEGGAARAPAAGHGYVWADENAKQRELAGNAARIEGWRNTRGYLSYIQDVAQLYTVRPLKGLDLHHMHDRLRTQRLTPAQSRDVYLAFARNVHSYDEVCLLLSVAPEAHGGLFYVALGLFHKDRDVRVQTSELLARVGAHEAGKHWWRALSRFEKLAYVRIRREAEAEMRSRLEKEGGFLPQSATAASAAMPAAMSGRGGGGGGIRGRGTTITPSTTSGSGAGAMPLPIAVGGKRTS